MRECGIQACLRRRRGVVDDDIAAGDGKWVLPLVTNSRRKDWPGFTASGLAAQSAGTVWASAVSGRGPRTAAGRRGPGGEGVPAAGGHARAAWRSAGTETTVGDMEVARARRGGRQSGAERERRIRFRGHGSRLSWVMASVTVTAGRVTAAVADHCPILRRSSNRLSAVREAPCVAILVLARYDRAMQSQRTRIRTVSPNAPRAPGPRRP